MALWETTLSKYHYNYTTTKSVRHCKSLFLIITLFKNKFKCKLNFPKAFEKQRVLLKKKANIQTKNPPTIACFEMENTKGKI